MGDLNLRSARIYPYRLKLTPSIQPKYGPFREGRLVSLTSRSGIVGWGDASPLPGFSLESIDDVDAAWDSVAGDLEILADDFEGPAPETPPSLKFGLEQAKWSILGQSRGVLPPALIDPEHRETVRVAGLVDAPPEEATSNCLELMDAGYRSIKIKTGRWDRDRAGRFFRQIRGSTGSEIALHLDANRAWTFDDACFILEAAAEADIEYVEEPLRDPSRLPLLADRIPVPIALDETLVQTDPSSLSDFDFAAFAILKPSLLGGLERSLDFAKEARSADMIPLVSSSIESGLGLLWLVALASAGVFGESAGLDTYQYLEEDVLADPFEPGSDIDVSETKRLYQTPLLNG
jgi:O-succinylbenzoate synthase